MSNSRTRVVAVSAASTGLVVGLALGVTGLASASTPSPTPSTGSSAGSSAGQGPHGHRGGRGHHEGDLVTAVTSSTISLDTLSGPKTVALTPTTTYRRGGAAASLTDVKPNENVYLQLVDPTASALVAQQVFIEMAHAGGFVTSVNGQSFTLVGADGFSRTVTETSTTVYRNAGAAGSPSEVSVGKFIRAEGNVDPNGATLEATRIGTGDAPPRMTTGNAQMPMTPSGVTG